MPPIYLDEAHRFSLTDFAHGKPFASFLPGIAGVSGTPMWVFYVNRGQAIASFGVESKDAPIMEFQPANKSYQMTPYAGFRTFLKLTRGAATTCYEPFAPGNPGGATTRMLIGANELQIEEHSPEQALRTTVTYFTLTDEPFAGLARQVTLHNLSGGPLQVDLLDGMPAVIPYGVNNSLLKDIGRTCEAWMEVFNRESNVPFYRLRASVIDRVEVETFQAGHFALALVDGKPLNALVDPVTVFGADTSFTIPHGFYKQSLESLLVQPQVTCGRTPCGLFVWQGVLEAGQSLTLFSLYGHIGGPELLQKHLPRIVQTGYFEQQHQAALDLAQRLTDTVGTSTAEPLFDAYIRQNFLDNVLRGGWPMLLGDEQRHVYPIYSRKHGDLERDYNAFFIAPEPYSQGEGSYRDVNQNRRDNVLLAPAQGDFDIRTFMSLIQSDGYNPRTVKGSTFTLAPDKLDGLLSFPQGETLRPVLSKSFSPGKLLKWIVEHEIELPVPAGEFLNRVLGQAEQHIEATFFEGFWIDHWEYNLDLIENYLAVYPERQDALFFGARDLPFFDSPVSVQPRAKKYVLSGGQARQIGSLLEDEEKAALIASRASERNWMRTQHGHGEIYRTTLFAKMVLVGLLKFASLDPWGMGIEMEASRPGWYDALNGLPALFGSGMSETYELQRWLTFLRRLIQAKKEGECALPSEAAFLLIGVRTALTAYQAMAEMEPAKREFLYWDAVAAVRETYRARTRLGIDGNEAILSLAELDATLATFQEKVTAGMARALELNHGLPPTYFTFRMDEYDVLAEKDAQGRPYLRARSFTPHVLPPFLEGTVRAYKVLPDLAAARQLYRQVKASPLYDTELQMYKINASLESEPFDIGRARAFPRGWLENESIWMHMEYKYLLELLRSELYEEYFEDLRHTLVPFLDPQVYGRSTLENSSFLASSAHPDPSMHGEGFVARLTGSTAEFQSMWQIMMAGRKPFFLHESGLCLSLRPILPSWLFSEAGEVTFRFLGSCDVTYHNPQRLDTFRDGVCPQRIVLRAEGGAIIEINGDVIGAPHAEQVRRGQIQRMDVYF